MRLSTTLLAVAILVCGCSGGNAPQAKASPTPQASPAETPSPEPSPSPSVSPDTTPSASPTAVPFPTPVPVTGTFGVLVSPPTEGWYTVSVIAASGKVTAYKKVSAPAPVTCPGAGADVPIPISTSNSGVYYEESGGGVTFMSPSGQLHQAASVPAGTASRRSMFAVSPDDTRIAVVVADFTSSGASTRLYVEDVNGANHVVIFTETGAYTLWPIGWHGTNNLVVAKVPACTQGGGPGCCGPQEFHVIDPATAVRRYTLGGPGCLPVGLPSPAGAICENSSFTSVNILNWNGTTRRSFAINGPTPAYIAPSSNGGIEGLTQVATFNGSDTAIVDGGHTLAQFSVCGWIDDTHVLAGGDAQRQPRVGNISTGVVTPVAALGDCAGRIPGGI